MAPTQQHFEALPDTPEMRPDPARLRALAGYYTQASYTTANQRVRSYLAEHAFEFAQRAEAISRGADVGAPKAESKDAPMGDLLMMVSAHLRERAAHCREMARAANSVGIAEELCTIAREYDDDATRIETHVPQREKEFGSA